MPIIEYIIVEEKFPFFKCFVEAKDAFPREISRITGEPIAYPPSCVDGLRFVCPNCGTAGDTVYEISMPRFGAAGTCQCGVQWRLNASALYPPLGGAVHVKVREKDIVPKQSSASQLADTAHLESTSADDHVPPGTHFRVPRGICRHLE